jgi:hypothetical protein
LVVEGCRAELPETICGVAEALANAGGVAGAVVVADVGQLHKPVSPLQVPTPEQFWQLLQLGQPTHVHVSGQLTSHKAPLQPILQTHCPVSWSHVPAPLHGLSALGRHAVQFGP